ncbi:MAG: fibronectin type III domain-containing protein [Pedosphaera sp.]|nr:fibronectin type III domain-containing protein [Pedosphaera sp.]
MAKVKLNLASLSDAATLQLANAIKTAMTGNANYTTPVPALTAVGTLITTAQTKVNDSAAAQLAAKMKTDDKNAAMDALRAGLTQLSSYVEAASAGDAVKIQSAGMDVKAASTPGGVPAQVVNLAVAVGDNDGELDAQWDPVPGAKTYEILASPDPINSNSWVNKPTVTKSKTVLPGLTSGQRVHIRVRAVAAAGQGPWCDPGSKIVP